MTKEATPPSDGLVEVTQADRDAAARWCGYGPNTNDRIRAAECDHLPGVQAFARHRLTALTPPATPLPDGLASELLRLVEVRQIGAIMEDGETEGAVARRILRANNDIAEFVGANWPTILTALTEEGLVERVPHQPLTQPVPDRIWLIDGGADDPIRWDDGPEEGLPAVEYIRTDLAAIAAGAVQQEGAYRAAMERAIKIIDRNLYHQSEKVEDAAHILRQALTQSDLTPGTGEGA